MSNSQIDQLKNILFIDIETVSVVEKYDNLDERLKLLWRNKSKFFAVDHISCEESFDKKAAIFAEFGKIIVIGLGFFYTDKSGDLAFRVKSIHGDDEIVVLNEFNKVLENKFNTIAHKLCAHNGKEFDFPYLCRRMLINNIALPNILKINDKKPWEIPHYDTMEMWKFGDKKAYTSLELLAAVLQIPSSKDGIDGSMVNETFYKNNDIGKIADYCLRDVVVTSQIFLKLNGHAILNHNKINFL